MKTYAFNVLKIKVLDFSMNSFLITKI